jgi:signal transduction histidine kinase
VFGTPGGQLFEEQIVIGEATHWYGFNVQALPPGTESVPMVQVIARDITEQKRTERQLRRYAEELEKRNDDIRNFAYIVSHDLRAPLVNLKGFSAELRAAVNEVKPFMAGLVPQLPEGERQRVQMAMDEDVPEALEFIEHSVTRMDTFLSAVLQLSRFGRRELDFESVDVNAVAKDVLDSLRHQIERQGITVTLAPLPTVVADRTSIEQILNNLLSNAVKYLDPDRPGKIDVYAEQTEDETTFFVRDNGRGIATEDFDKVLMPFRRAGRQDVPGEGVGLSYADTLVRRHDGRLLFESELGAGSTFSFSISSHLAEG